MDQIISSSTHQKTLKSRISCQGVGLHSGRRVTLVITPAPIDTGIRFKRTDGPAAGQTLLASWNNVVDTQLCTTLGNGGVVIGTIEHLMAACSRSVSTMTPSSTSFL